MTHSSTGRRGRKPRDKNREARGHLLERYSSYAAAVMARSMLRQAGRRCGLTPGVSHELRRACEALEERGLILIDRRLLEAQPMTLTDDGAHELALLNRAGVRP